VSPRDISRRTFLGASVTVAAVASADHRLGRLRPAGGSGGLPAPTDVLVTRWAADPYARGAFSFNRIGSGPSDRRALAAPVDGRLYFAGEATSDDRPGTVPGALLSGRRAARQVDGVAPSGAAVIVVGAGIAGLAAAAHLQVTGHRVTVLEARDRLGGRIWTSRDFGPPVELGALWIRGAQGNPLTRVADHIGAARLTANARHTVTYDVNGAPLSAGVLRHLDASYRAALRGAEATRARAAPDASLGAALAASRPYQNLSPSARAPLDYEVSTGIECEHAADVSELALATWNEGRSFAGPDVLFRDGYDQVIQHAARDLDVRRRAPVHRVEYGDAGVTVTTAQGTAHADYAVVTLPLGVLQSSTVVFAPDLPDTKRQAIAALGSGVVNHVLLQFPRVFWDRSAEIIGHVDAQKGRWARWVNLASYTGAPVLLGVNAATYARELEARTKAQVVADAMNVLGSIYG
jgi:monoamine oxidase